MENRSSSPCPVVPIVDQINPAHNAPPPAYFCIIHLVSSLYLHKECETEMNAVTAIL
jgi:hypothetical protein